MGYLLRLILRIGGAMIVAKIYRRANDNIGFESLRN